jgi:hypothetical protein
LSVVASFPYASKWTAWAAINKAMRMRMRIKLFDALINA